MSTLQLERLRPVLAADKAKFAGDLDQIRRAFEEMLTKFPPAPGVTFERETAGGVPASWCIPPDAVQGRVLLYLHGGGYVVGSARAYQPMVSRLASRLRTRALIPDYRLAPENPFPAALEDAIAVYRWLLDQGIAPQSIALTGDSAGGGLAVSCMASIRAAGLPLPVGAAVISPWADLEVAGESGVSKAQDDPILEVAGLQGMAGAYLGAASPRTPSASPVYADLAGLPPLLIQVGSAEILLDDATRLAARAGAAGVKVRLDIWPEMFHVWHFYASLLDEGREALDEVAAFLESLLSRQKESIAAEARA
ncbi:MAG: alpha/beta hydrolase [Bryobacteraceae bacterium]|jgi:phosphinothricin tripeptide acetyl hydrolase